MGCAVVVFLRFAEFIRLGCTEDDVRKFREPEPVASCVTRSCERVTFDVAGTVKFAGRALRTIGVEGRYRAREAELLRVSIYRVRSITRVG